MPSRIYSTGEAALPPMSRVGSELFPAEPAWGVRAGDRGELWSVVANGPLTTAPDLSRLSLN
jgi:hypothetical protein